MVLLPYATEGLRNLIAWTQSIYLRFRHFAQRSFPGPCRNPKDWNGSHFCFDQNVVFNQRQSLLVIRILELQIG